MLWVVKVEPSVLGLVPASPGGGKQWATTRAAMWLPAPQAWGEAPRRNHIPTPPWGVCGRSTVGCFHPLPFEGGGLCTSIGGTLPSQTAALQSKCKVPTHDLWVIFRPCSNQNPGRDQVVPITPTNPISCMPPSSSVLLCIQMQLLRARSAALPSHRPPAAAPVPSGTSPKHCASSGRCHAANQSEDSPAADPVLPTGVSALISQIHCKR